MSLFIYLFLLFSILPSSVSGAAACLSVFSQEARDPLPQTLDASDLIADLRKQYKDDPASLPHLEARALDVAHSALVFQAVQFTVLESAGKTFFIIHPSDGPSPLNRLAYRLQERYGFYLGFKPDALITHDFGAYFANSARKPDGGISDRVLFLGLEHIMSGSTNRFSRDISLLHEFRHLDLVNRLVQRRPSPLFGEIIIDGKLAGDSGWPHYSYFLSISEIKTYHTQIKEHLTEMRALLRAGASREAIAQQTITINFYLNMLNAVSQRTGLALALVGQIEFVNFKVIQDVYDVVTVKMTYEKDSTKVILEIPVVEAQNLEDANVSALFNQQLRWTFSMAAEAMNQSSKAHQLFQQLSSRPSGASQIELIDHMQKILGTSQLIPPRPPLY